MELRKISQEELNRIIEDHQHWLEGDCEGWEKMRADLSYADLRCANLSNTDLKDTIFKNAILRGVDLSFAGLSYANLKGADLRYGNLSYAVLSDANLRETNLTSANLKGANLSCANLRNSILSCANLINADLIEVYHDYATSFFSLQCPEEGSFIGYKKSGDKIVKIRIEEDSKRSSGTSRKCRASKVTVLSITSIDGTEEFQKSENTGSYNFTYEVGKTYEIDNFDDNRWNECSTGIHFFITRDEAVKY